MVPAAAWGINTVTEGFRVANVTTQINAHGICKNVTANDGKTYFVPTRTSAEWTTFLAQKPTTVSATNCVMAPTCNGTSYGGYCWYLTAQNQSCDQICAAHAGVNVVGTNAYGAGGSDAQCAALMTQLHPGINTWGVSLRNIPLCDAAANYGWGCYMVTNLNTAYRCEYPLRTDTAFFNTQRACACNN